ncbi:acyltransferase [Bacillus toyonensis]|uniref:acyltransferase n=1 Tax=Bacillus toyonensis TaxID=155322 RepID=UPI000BFE683B|nr:acyltransferase [Bacillus toyonensis]PHF43404.1 hypothetical protein COI39_19020 [Bacillus toyonensis]
MIELLSKVIKKMYIFIYKLINYSVYKQGIILYGIPKLIERKNIKIEKNVRVNDNVFMHGAGGIVLRENVTLSYGVTILSTGYDTSNWAENKIGKIHKNQKVIIGKNVWLCANVTVLPGVNIADDIIVAAGSVVTESLLEPGYMYGGIPAKQIKKII